jgi:hypothetical protein
MDNDMSTMSLSLCMKKTLLVRVAQTCSYLHGDLVSYDSCGHDE